MRFASFAYEHDFPKMERSPRKNGNRARSVPQGATCVREGGRWYVARTTPVSTRYRLGSSDATPGWKRRACPKRWARCVSGANVAPGNCSGVRGVSRAKPRTRNCTRRAQPGQTRDDGTFGAFVGRAGLIRTKGTFVPRPHCRDNALVPVRQGWRRAWHVAMTC